MFTCAQIVRRSPLLSGVLSLLVACLSGSCHRSDPSSTSEEPSGKTTAASKAAESVPRDGEPGHGDEVFSIPEKPVTVPALEARGKTLYAKHCSTCHGTTGRGDGRAAYLLFPKPRDFGRGGYRLVSTANSQPSDADLYRTVSRGMPGSAMPPWEHLTPDDRWALVSEVRRLTRAGFIADELRDVEKAELVEARAEAEEIADEILTPGDAVAVPAKLGPTLERLARGRVLYIQNCAPCHDDDGRGRTRRDLKDNDGRPIFARDFTLGIFKGSADGEQIAYRILAGMPGTPMPSYNNIFADSPEDLWSIVHHVRSLVPSAAQERVSQRKRRIRVLRSSTALTDDLESAAWTDAPAMYVALMPLWWRDERVEGVLVRALHDGENIAFHLEWVDPTEDRLALRTRGFSDSAAIQLSSSSDPPLFAMGDKEGQVSIWHWKAHWESDLNGHEDVESVYPLAAVDHYPSANPPRYGEQVTVKDYPIATVVPEFLTAFGVGNPAADPKRPPAVENLASSGFGTLTSRAPALQKVAGKSRWDRGKWELVILRPLSVGGEDVVLAPGGELSVAFGIWDGAAGDRDGQKSVSIWHALRIEN